MPGADTPVERAVCGQCDAASKRDAESAVYCTCRCGPADDAPLDPDASYCGCPDGFECSELLPYWLGQSSAAGKYCIKSGTAYSESSTCGTVAGFSGSSTCEGAPN